MGLLCSLAFSIQFLLLFSSFLFTNSLSLNHSTATHHHECHQHESNALLSFKQNFIISKSASYNPLSYPKTLSWIPTTDCCSWDGIECDELTCHVIGIDLSSSQLYGSMDPNSTLFSLVHLQSLDLSDNDFNHSQIPAKIGDLSQLRHLSLSHGNENTFSGEVPPQVSQLSNLLSLDLHSYPLEPLPYDLINNLQLKASTLTSLTQNTTRLEHLRLDFVTISSSLPHTLTNLTSLQMLSLFSCDLHGEFPVGIFHLPNLAVLNLGQNQNLRGRLPNFFSSSFVNIRDTSFYGTLPTSIENLTSLNWFSISSCSFYGAIPSSLGNLTQLALLDLSNNGFEGEIPHSLFRLENLEYLSLSYNFLEGQLALDMFLKLTRLNDLELSHNKLSLFSQNRAVNETILPPIQWLGLSRCNLNGEIPTWIMNLTTLNHLDLHENNLQGEIPYFLFILENLTGLDLNGNVLEGQIELEMLSKLKKLTLLGLGGGNKLYFLEGKNTSNVTFPSQIQFLDLSSCNLVHFPNFIQHLQELTDLSISHNRIKTIPSWMWNKTTLQSLVISNNLLMGEIPPSICNLQSLGCLDLSSNNLVGMIPSCIGSFSRSLHILSLARNKLIEIIKTFKSMTLSNTSHQVQFKDDVYLLQHSSVDISLFVFPMHNKGVVMEYLGRQYFHYMIAIDLSCNKIFGEIPDIMGSLNGLVVLNLSNNMFTGSIPSSFGKLSNLEALDLSSNSLSGEIPQQLTELTFLEFFNVSFNNLSGPIPENGQLSTFQDNSFEGNKGLCGFQLLNKCEDRSKLPLPPTPDGDQDSESGSFFEFNWMVILIGYGGGLVAGLALGNAFAGDVFRLMKRIF
ncbi:receptor-like protein 12 isoform X1 [Arachis ipaensis]|uniref:receptor-like protein 12 isoform X1 n=1 Tax=Arachis ipaensis TaxID=130454 RepID=UPI000A2B7B10|nr:receptor-like protein 12 isoform X1 [Arachis ipaensis]